MFYSHILKFSWQVFIKGQMFEATETENIAVSEAGFGN